MVKAILEAWTKKAPSDVLAARLAQLEEQAQFIRETEQHVKFKRK
jgi:hypothetical protein